MSQAEAIAKALGGARRSSRGWLVRCPAHNDRSPSLSLADGKDGRLLVKCFAGCEPRAIFSLLRQAGLTDFSEPVNAPTKIASSLDWSDKAESIWRSANPLMGTPVEKYLLGRGCALPGTDEIRFRPSRGRG